MMNPLSQYLMIGKLVALLGAIALICYQGSQIHKWHKHSLALSAKLEAISTKRNEQKIITKERIVIAQRKAKDADGVAKKIEAAPIVPGCKTPPEIMSAEL